MDEQLVKTEEVLTLNTTPTITSARTMQELDEAEAKFDPMMAPSGMIGLYLPKVLDIVETLSNKSLKRLIAALLAYPLEDLRPNKNNQAEVSAYIMGDRILQSKYLLILHTAMEAEERKNAQKNRTNEIGENGISQSSGNSILGSTLHEQSAPPSIFNSVPEMPKTE